MKPFCLMMLVTLAACSSGRALQSQESSGADPGRAAVMQELETLPFKHIDWFFAFRLPIARVTLGADHLYLETEDRALVTVDRRTGETDWKYHVDSGQHLDWAPLEATGVPDEIRRLEARLFENAREIEDVVKEKGPGEESQKLWSVRKDLQQNLQGARRGDNVYLFSQHTVYCLDRTTGNVRWKRRLDFAPSGRSFATKSLLFVPGGDRPRVWMLDINDGGRDITFYRPELAADAKNLLFNRPIYSDPTLFFSSQDGRVYAFDVAQRRQRWTYETERELKTDPVLHAFSEVDRNVRGEPIGENPTPRDHQLLFVGGMDKAFYAIDAQAGSLRWKYEAGETLLNSPVVVGRSVYVRTSTGEMLSLDLNPMHFGSDGLPTGPVRNGRLQWKLAGVDQFLMKGKNHLYFRDAKGAIVAVDEVSGKVSARYPLRQFRFIPTNTADDFFYLIHPAGHVYGVKESKEEF